MLAKTDPRNLKQKLRVNLPGFPLSRERRHYDLPIIQIDRLYVMVCYVSIAEWALLRTAVFMRISLHLASRIRQLIGHRTLIALLLPTF